MEICYLKVKLAAMCVIKTHSSNTHETCDVML